MNVCYAPLEKKVYIQSFREAATGTLSHASVMEHVYGPEASSPSPAFPKIGGITPTGYRVIC